MMKNIDQNMFLHSSFRIRTGTAKFESGWPLMLDVHTMAGQPFLEIFSKCVISKLQECKGYNVSET